MNAAILCDSAHVDCFNVPTIRASVVVALERDHRNRSRMNDETKRVDALLMEWAKWGRGALAHLNFPRETLDSRVARYGFVGAAQAGASPEWPPHIKLVERAILKIQMIERSVIVEEYLNQHEPREVHARRRHMSVTRYGKILERGRKSVRLEMLALSHTFE